VPALDWRAHLKALICEARKIDPAASHASLSGHRYPKAMVPLLERWLRSALFEIASDDIVAELVRLATTRSYRRARQMIVMALGRPRRVPNAPARRLSARRRPQGSRRLG
jgi:hypothetical protein